MNFKLATGFGMALLFGGGVVTNAFSQNATTASKNDRHLTTTNLLIVSEFFKVPDNEMSGLNIRWQPVAPAGASAILSAVEHTELTAALKRNKNVTSLGAPRIAFTPPTAGETRQGSMTIGKAVKIAGTNANVGINLDVEATLLPDNKTLKLHLNAESSELAEGSQTDLRTTTARIDASLKTNPGQTVVVRQPATDGSQSLLIFVTPQISRMNERLQHVIKKPSTVSP